MNKKKVATVLGSVGLIAAIGIGGTFAYLTDTTDTVSNTFTVGDVGIDLKESTVSTSGTDGEVVQVQGLDTPLGKYQYDTDGENSWTATENLYEGLCESEWVYKDPTVKVDAGSQDAYIYAKIDNFDGFSAINMKADWEEVGVVKDDKGKVTSRVFAYKNKVSSGDNITIFDAVKMPEKFPTKDVQSTSEDGTTETKKEAYIPNLNITACAVQSAGFTSYKDANILNEVTFGEGTSFEIVSSTPEEQQVE